MLLQYLGLIKIYGPTERHQRKVKPQIGCCHGNQRESFPRKKEDSTELSAEEANEGEDWELIVGLSDSESIGTGDECNNDEKRSVREDWVKSKTETMCRIYLRSYIINGRHPHREIQGRLRCFWYGKDIIILHMYVKL